MPLAEARGLRPTTVAAYQGYFDRHILPAIGHVRLCDITPLMGDDFFGAMKHKRMTQKGHTHKTLTASTVGHTHALINQSLIAAVRWRLLADNPASQASPPRPKSYRKEVVAWDESEAVAFLRRAESRGTRFYPLWYLLLATGLRRGEALGLHWSDITWDGGTISVTKALTVTPGKGRGGYRLTATKTTKGSGPFGSGPTYSLFYEPVSGSRQGSDGPRVRSGLNRTSSSPRFKAHRYPRKVLRTGSLINSQSPCATASRFDGSRCTGYATPL